MAPKRPKIDAVDLFCGAGGLTAGLRRAGLNVRAGYDIDESCRFAYETNNPSKFSTKDVEMLTGAELSKWYSSASVRLLAGCAPCQPFSTYNLGRDTSSDRKWPLLNSFTRLIREVGPELVSMENVPEVTRHSIYQDFVNGLKDSGYYVWANKVDCAKYGLPQKRFRHVLLASKLGEIELIPPPALGQCMTVRDAIAHLPPIEAGQVSKADPLHRAAKLSSLNMKRIRASVPGGTWSDWPVELRAACHQRESGQSYPSVYGRMSWDEPSPTMTTLCHGFGNGRFGHPEQDRGISLREAALLQSFPSDYKFAPDNEVTMRAVGRMIGNAVPVRIGEVIGTSLLQHVAHRGFQAPLRR
ncbi:DNA cytosine methyltransferase [Stenotrophomonas sp. RG-453]|uniref:DNA cytosine methyltransferase n=1 Tax=Stenotrophomonas sp. RG-453 TaxID=2957502 RepID=UPI0029C9F491|nr:DNA cytosine methyltransferase [Stenotrophomonas sp. RG-453]MDX5516195.1 DNA cytosine methyltransferase [Stenotrophomonas sp. RG-453]